MMTKHWKAKNNYGLKLTKVSLDEVYYGNGTLREICPTLVRRPRFYTLLKQKELQHPILVWKNMTLHIGGLRCTVAVDRGYDYIDALISNDQDLLERIRKIQKEDAHNYIPIDEMEASEYEGLKRIQAQDPRHNQW